MIKLDSYYQDREKEILREDLLTDRAQEWARNFITVRPRLNAAQLRRFLNEVKALEALVEAERGADGFKKVRPLIKMLKSKVAYSAGGKKVPEEFKEFIIACVDNINDGKDFRAFVLLFEAVVGFFYGEGGGRG